MPTKRIALQAVLAVLCLTNTYISFGSRRTGSEEGRKMFKGLRLAVYYAHDINKAKEWYSDVLGFKPYFAEPYYVGFNVGGFELGLQPAEEKTAVGSNEIAYWGVENADDAYKYLLEHGAKKHSDVQDVGGGIRVATVLDPFGNIFGVIENPNFKIEEAK